VNQAITYFGEVMLATLVVPSVNPFSWALLFLCVICSSAAIIVSPYSAVSTKQKQIVSSLFAVILLVFPAACWSRYYGYTDDGIMASIVAIAFAMGFSLSGFRGRSKFFGRLALLTSYAALGLSAYALDVFVYLLAHNLDIHPTAKKWILLFTWIASLVLMVAWLPVSIRILGRHYKQAATDVGCCPACDYDLRGSVGQPDCPECGQAIPWDKIKLPG